MHLLPSRCSMSYTASSCTSRWAAQHARRLLSQPCSVCRSCLPHATASRQRQAFLGQQSGAGPSAVAARSILDSYRASQQQTAERGDGADAAAEELCSAECVTQIYSAAEFEAHLARLPDNVLVVVDFYRCNFLRTPAAQKPATLCFYGLWLSQAIGSSSWSSGTESCAVMQASSPHKALARSLVTRT